MHPSKAQDRSVGSLPQEPETVEEPAPQADAMSVMSWQAVI